MKILGLLFFTTISLMAMQDNNGLRPRIARVSDRGVRLMSFEYGDGRALLLSDGTAYVIPVHKVEHGYNQRNTPSLVDRAGAVIIGGAAAGGSLYYLCQEPIKGVLLAAASLLCCWLGCDQKAPWQE